MKAGSLQANKAALGWVLALTGVGSLMAALDTLVVSTALSTIRLDLGASVGQLEWTVNAYNIAFAVLLMTGAAVGDRYGRRRMYAMGRGGVGGLRAGEQRRVARGRARPTGRRRRTRAPALPCAPERGVPAGATRSRNRHLQRYHWDLCRQRAARRRRRRPGARLAVDLLAERPDRAGSRAAGAHADR
jgi:hypothetical protein